MRTESRRLTLCLAGLLVTLMVPRAAVVASAPQAAQPPRQAPSVTSRTAPSASPEASETFAMQVLLDRAGFSPGEIDGRGGLNTIRAREAFRSARKLGPGPDARILASLRSDTAPLVIDYTITAKDCAGPFVSRMPTDMMQLAKLPALSYTSVLELIAERTHSKPALLLALNPGATFTEGETIRVPNVGRPMTLPEPAPATPDVTAPAAARPPEPAGPLASRIVVSRSRSGLTVFGENDVVLFFAPVTSGSQADPLPIGTWKVMGVARLPRFDYDPALFWNAEPGHSKARVPAGPNNPVGTVWIDLDKEHYGIHGTPEPGKIGHATSHGCVRLTNWDALTVASFVRPGTVVVFEP